MYKIAIIGRPNVGKSTIFNRLAVNTKSIAHDAPGTTRDRNYSVGELFGVRFIVIDTPGLEENKEGLEQEMLKQALLAAEEADLILFVVDGRFGITPIDKLFASIIRKYRVILIINKCEKSIVPDKDYYRLGFNDMVQISASHKLGFEQLYEVLSNKLSFSFEEEFQEDSINITIIGRPNSGKSTLVNALLGETRVITDSRSGTTRDSIEVSWYYKNYLFKLVDTAGLRKRSKVEEGLELLANKSTIHAINFSNVVVLLLDAERGLEKQDLTIANLAFKEGRCLIVAVNKWDLIQNKIEYKRNLTNTLSYSFPQARGIRVLYISALNGQDINSIVDEAVLVYTSWTTKIPTGKLNQWIKSTTLDRALKKGGLTFKIKYGVQTKIKPMTFKLFCNNTEIVTEGHKKYLINSLRERFGLNSGAPIRMIFQLK